MSYPHIWLLIQSFQAPPLAALATLEEYLALLAAVEILPAATVSDLAEQVVTSDHVVGLAEAEAGPAAEDEDGCGQLRRPLWDGQGVFP